MTDEDAELRSVASKVSTQHRLLRSLIAGLDKNLLQGNLAGAQQKLASLRTALRAHFDLEENHYFPERCEATPDIADVLAQLAHEHTQMQADLEGISLCIDQSELTQAADAMAAFTALFGEHETRERKVLES